MMAERRLGCTISPMTARPSTNLPAPYEAKVRYHYWTKVSVRQVRCPHGHVFTPDLRLLVGKGDVFCRHRVTPPGRPIGEPQPGAPICGATLLVVCSPDRPGERLIAEISQADMDFMEQIKMSPDAEVRYLERTPVRR